jgi:hypothetical protein
LRRRKKRKKKKNDDKDMKERCGCADKRRQGGECEMVREIVKKKTKRLKRCGGAERSSPQQHHTSIQNN